MNTQPSIDRIAQLEKRLVECNEQLTFAAEAANLGIWQWDPATDVLYLSARAQALLGLEGEGCHSVNALVSRVHERFRAKLTDAFESAVSSGVAMSVTFAVLVANGRERWLHNMGRAIGPNGPGRATLIAGVLRDASQDIRAAQTLDKRRHYLQRQLLLASTAGVAKFDRGLRLISNNERFQQGLGLAQDSLQGRTLDSILPYLPPSWRESCTLCLEGLSLSADAGIHACQGYSGLRTRGHFYAWFGEDDQVGGVVLVMVPEVKADVPEDVARHEPGSMDTGARAMAVDDGSALSARSAQGLVEQRVVNSGPQAKPKRQLGPPPGRANAWLDDALRRLAHLAPIGILLLEESGAIRYANPAWQALVAADSADPAPVNWLDLVHSDDRRRVATELLADRQRAGASCQFRYLRKGGEPRWVLGTSIPFPTDSVDTRASLVVHVEVGEFVQRARDLERQRDNLRALFHHVDLLRDLERRELAGLLQDQVAECVDRLAVDLEVLARDGNVAEGLKDSLRYLARHAESGREQVRQLTFELNPPGVGELGFEFALDRFVTEQESRAGIAIDLRLPSKPVRAAQEVLMGLFTVAREAITNAVDHARATRIDVWIEADEDIVKLRVNDNGIGISEQNRLKAGCFGLIAAKERLLRLGGTLRAFSVPSTGTTLEASVPASGEAREPSFGGSAPWPLK